MPIYGQNEATEAISNSPFGGLFAARVIGTDEPDRVVKLHWPPPYVLTHEQEKARLDAFLESVRLQMSLKKHWAEIYEAEPIPGGAFYAGRRYPLTARKLIASQTPVSDADLAAIVHGIVDGLVELDAAAHRPHANLKPENVLLCRKDENGRSGPLNVCLTDPAGRAAAAGQTSAADTYALGTIIYELVTLQKFPGPRAWPLIASDAWSRLGPGAGDAWCTLCNRLLHPNPEQGVINLTELATVLRRTQSLRPGGRSRRWRIAAAVVLLGIAGGTVALLLPWHPTEPAVVAEKQSPIVQLLARAQAAVDAQDDTTARSLADEVLAADHENRQAAAIKRGIEARRKTSEARELREKLDSDVHGNLQDARASLSIHDFDTALKKTDAALALDPGNVEASDLKKLVQIEQDQYGRQQAAIQQDKDFNDMLNRARSDLSAGRPDDAGREVDQALALEPNKRDAVASLQKEVNDFRQKLRRGQDDAGAIKIEADRKAARQRQEEIDASITGSLKRAREKDAAGDERAALDELDHVLARNPAHPDAADLRQGVIDRLVEKIERDASLDEASACDTPARAGEGVEKIRALTAVWPDNPDVLKVQMHFRQSYIQAWAASWLRDVSKTLETMPHSEASDRLVFGLFQAQRRAGDDAGAALTLMRAMKIAETDPKPAAAVEATVKVATLQLIAGDKPAAHVSIAQAERIRAGVASDAPGVDADRLIILAKARAGDRRLAGDALAALIDHLRDEQFPAGAELGIELNREFAGGLAWGRDFGPELNPGAEDGPETNVEIDLARLRSGDPLKAAAARRSAAAALTGRGFNACIQAEVRSGNVDSAKIFAEFSAADQIAVEQARGGDVDGAKSTLAQAPPGTQSLHSVSHAWAAIIAAEAFKDPDAARNDLKAHLPEPNPERRSALAGIASGLIFNGRVDEARSLLQQFSNSDEDWKLKTDPLSRLIETMAAAGNLAGAHEMAASVPPAYRLTALRGLVRGIAHGGQYDAAEKTAADEAHQAGFDGSKNDLLKTIAQYAGETGDRDAAMRWLDAKPRDPGLRIELLAALCNGMSATLPPRFDYRLDIDGREKYWRPWAEQN